MLDISFLTGQVRYSIQSDVVDVSQNPSGSGAGWFGVPRQVFCFVDFLASVAYNKARGEVDVTSTPKAVRFIREYFPPHYREFANLLVAMWRHGTVHGFIPYTYYATSGRCKVTVRWSSNNDWVEHNRAVNLRFFDVEGEPGCVYLAINTCQLADDLMDAFDRLVDKMERKPSFGRACIRRLNRALAPRSVNSKRTRVAGRDKVAAQILAAPKATAGVIRGNQVTWYGEPST